MCVCVCLCVCVCACVCVASSTLHAACHRHDLRFELSLVQVAPQGAAWLLPMPLRQRQLVVLSLTMRNIVHLPQPRTDAVLWK